MTDSPEETKPAEERESLDMRIAGKAGTVAGTATAYLLIIGLPVALVVALVWWLI